jgi:hypothetical protein
MLDAILQPELPPAATGGPETLVDIGSGAGLVVLFAGLTGLQCIGIELVPARHAAAASTLHRLQQHCASPLPVELVCADALAATAPYARATRLFCNNAIRPDSLTAAMAAHVAGHTPRLAAFATVRPTPPAAAAAVGLALQRTTAVSVTWDRIGAPLHVYVPAGREGSAATEAERYDERYHAAREGCLGELSMV